MSFHDGGTHALTSQIQLRVIDPLSKKEVISKQTTLNGFAQEAYYKQIFNFNRAFTIIMLAQLLLLYLYVAILPSVGKSHALMFLNCTSICGILACLVLILRFQSKNRQHRLNDEISESWFIVFSKFVIVLVAPYSFLDQIRFSEPENYHNQNIQAFKLNYLLAIFTFFKNITFFSMVLTYSKYMKPRANRISKFYGSQSGSIFTIRAIFKDSPFKVSLCAFIISIIVFSFSFRVAESSIYSSSGVGTIYCNMIWMTLITMTTVGYGDYTPFTSIGKAIGCLCVVWGALMLSVMVVVLTKAFELKRNESQTLRIINKLQQREKIRQVAGQVIRQSLWRVWTNYRYRLNKKNQLKQRKLLQYFHQLRKIQEITFQCKNTQFYRQFSKKFDGAQSNIETLIINNNKLISHVSAQYIFKQLPLKQRQSAIKVKNDPVKILIKNRKKL